MKLTVLADDLTGAAEMAGVASRFGLNATILLRPTEASDSDLKIYNMDSRLFSPSEAGEAAKSCAHQADLKAPQNVFVKVDSVMRGHIRPQLEALADELKAQRIVLAPANPSKNRIIKEGQYLVDGVPLHQTAFNIDPHHPAHSPNPIDLLGRDGECPLIIAKPYQTLPSIGFIIAETATSEDMEALAAQLDATTLLAGAADFFSAVLKAKGYELISSPKTPELSGPLLWVCGSTASPDAIRFERELGAWSRSIPLSGESEAHCVTEINQILEKQGLAILHTNQTGERRLDPNHVTESVTHIVAEVVASGQPRHLLLEGGATAAAIVDALKFDALQTLHEWATGVVSFSPVGLPDLVLTFKPGSYRWPIALFRGTNFHSQDLFCQAHE